MSQSINYTTFASLYEHIIAGDNSTFLNGLRIGEYYSISTNEFGDIVRYLALALREMGINKGTPVALISDSSPWWLMIDYAIMIAGGYSVPMFTNLSQEHLDFELKDSAVKTVFIASNEKWQVMKTRKEQFDNLVLFEISDPDEHELHLENLIEDGKKIDASLPDLFNNMLNEVDPEQLATVVYTSGSTGNPKGVMLSHKNVISQLYATYDKFELKADDVAFSFLPLAHIFERMVMNYYLSNRVSVYFADDVKNVANLLKKVNPTLMTVVPRLLEKVYGKMQEKVETTEGASGLLARYAFNRAKTMDPFSDHAKFFDKCFTRTVYLKFLHAFGTNMRMVISGGAPLSPAIAEFFGHIGLELFEGYGLTEAAPVVSANCQSGRKIGTVGTKFNCVETKLNADGELLVRGPNVMVGYLNNPQETAKVIDSDGWLSTGDLASIDEEGFITIKGRKKELYKTSNGKYVSPIPIEQGISSSKYIDYALIIAEGRSHVSVLLFPDREYLGRYLERKGLEITVEEYMKHKKFRKKIETLIKHTNKHLDHWEQIQHFRLIDESISIESGDLTPSMKLCRYRVLKRFNTKIEEMYL